MPRQPAWRKKKTYGEYKTATCPFCNRMATQKNETGLDVCYKHLKAKLEEIKCTCGSWLEQKSGKFGPYFNCINCGNFNYDKGMQIKAITMKDKPKQVIQDKPKDPYAKPKFIKKEPKEITITSDDVQYFD